jgi:hypothetical protein
MFIVCTSSNAWRSHDSSAKQLAVALVRRLHDLASTASHRDAAIDTEEKTMNKDAVMLVPLTDHEAEAVAGGVVWEDYRLSENVLDYSGPFYQTMYNTESPGNAGVSASTWYIIGALGSNPVRRISY